MEPMVAHYEAKEMALNLDAATLYPHDLECKVWFKKISRDFLVDWVQALQNVEMTTKAKDNLSLVMLQHYRRCREQPAVLESAPADLKPYITRGLEIFEAHRKRCFDRASKYASDGWFGYSHDNTSLRAQTTELFWGKLYYTDGSNTLPMPCSTATVLGLMDRLQDLIRLGSKPSQRTFWIAADNGDMEILQYLWDLHCPTDRMAGVLAAKRGHLHVLKFLYDKHCIINEKTMDAAAEGGHLDCITFLHSTGVMWDKVTVHQATLFNHLDCLIFLLDQGCPISDDTINAACSHGNEEVFDLIMKRCNFVPRERFGLKAVNSGKLDRVKLLHSMGVPMTKETCVHAAWGNHLDILTWLHETLHVEWTKNTTEFAAEYGSLECLRYAVEHGCPIDIEQCKEGVSHNASTKNKAPILEYLNTLQNPTE